MRIEHIHFLVSDLEASTMFYKAAFPKWNVMRKGTALRRGRTCGWVHFGDDFHYIALTQYHSLTDVLVGTGFAHVGFEVDDVESVSERLIAAGAEVASLGDKQKYRKNIYFFDPDGNEIEFVQYLSGWARERNSDTPIKVKESV